MRGKRLAVKLFVYLAFVEWLGGIVFIVGYRVRHPIPENSNAHHDKQQSEGVVGVNSNNAAPNNEQGNDNQSYASKIFEPMTLLTFLLVVGVGITAYIYWRQLKKMEETVSLVGKQGKTMEGQLNAMKDQSETMQNQHTDSGLFFRVAQQSYVGIHSITDETLPSGWGFGKTILIKIENTGNVPADEIRVRIHWDWMLTKPAVATPPNVRDSDGGVLNKYFGRTKLSKGELKIEIQMPYNDLFSEDEFNLMNGGKVHLTVWGSIIYKDGFGDGNKTEFTFNRAGHGKWLIDAPWPEDIIQVIEDSREDEKDYSPA